MMYHSYHTGQTSEGEYCAKIRLVCSGIGSLPLSDDLPGQSRFQSTPSGFAGHHVSYWVAYTTYVCVYTCLS